MPNPALDIGIPENEGKPLPITGTPENNGSPQPTTGIVDAEIGSALDYKAPTTTPVTTEVDAGSETVESRLNDITAKGSRYTNLASADAKRSANTRGLINSTMAGAAGVDAAVRAALPIAQQDASTYTATRFKNQDTENEFLKNRQSADLNMETASHNSNLNQSMARLEQSFTESNMELDFELRTAFEQTMQSDRFSDEAKMNIVDTMNNIVRDTQQQIVTIGMSDRSASQQAAAIKAAEANRDASLKVYQKLLDSFDGWDWGTNFTPEATSGAGSGVSGFIDDSESSGSGSSGAGSVRPPKPTAPPDNWIWNDRAGRWQRSLGGGSR